MIKWDKPCYKCLSHLCDLSCKKALAQPEQEPVAWGVDWGKDGQQSCVSIVKRLPNGGIEVVAIEYNPTPSPPQRKPMTDEEIREIWVEHGCEGEDAEGFARAIEAAHGIGVEK